MAAAAAHRKPAEPDVFVLWPEHVEAFRVFQAVQTQFRWSDNRPTGLDWQSVRAHPACRAVRREDRERVLADVAEIEPAWLAERNRRITQALNEARQQR